MFQFLAQSDQTDFTLSPAQTDFEKDDDETSFKRRGADKFGRDDSDRNAGRKRAHNGDYEPDRPAKRQKREEEEESDRRRDGNRGDRRNLEADMPRRPDNRARGQGPPGGGPGRDFNDNRRYQTVSGKRRCPDFERKYLPEICFWK